MPTPSGFTALQAQNIQDASGTLLAAGSLNVQPTDQYDNPIVASAGGTQGGIVTVNQVAFPIVNGAIPAGTAVPDCALTRPQWISYRMTVRSAAGEPLAILRGVQPTGPLFSLDSYLPGSATLLEPAFNGTATDLVTGIQYRAVMVNGQATYIASTLLDGTPFAVVLVDSATGFSHALTIYRGALLPPQKLAGPGIGAVSGVTFIDSVSGVHTTLSVSNGALTYATVASTVPGVSQQLLADSFNGVHFALSFKNGAFQAVPA